MMLSTDLRADSSLRDSMQHISIAAWLPDSGEVKNCGLCFLEGNSFGTAPVGTKVREDIRVFLSRSSNISSFCALALALLCRLPDTFVPLKVFFGQALEHMRVYVFVFSYPKMPEPMRCAYDRTQQMANKAMTIPNMACVARGNTDVITRQMSGKMTHM